MRELPVRSYQRKLPVALKPKELDAKRDQIAAKVHEYGDVEDEKKERVGEYSKRLKGLRSEIDTLGEQITTRSEERDVECVEVPDYSSGTMSIIRQDTEEVIDSRPLTAGERQASFAN